MLWNGIVGSVVVVWFLFQVMESFMGAYQYFQIMSESHRQKSKEEVRRKGRLAERERQSRFEQELINQRGSEDKIRNARKFLDSHRRIASDYPIRVGE